jgi:hypothetical protein
VTSDEFTFEVPPGWTRAAEAERLTFTDGRGGVLVVSSFRVTPAEPAGSEAVLEAVLANAFAAARRAASDPELQQVSELHESKHRNLRCWTGEARSRDGAVLFSQCVLASQRGVFLATLETPSPEQSHRDLFQSFVNSVFSSDLRRILRHVRNTPPTCVAGAAPILDDPDPEPDPRDTEQFGTTFRLGCPCGSRHTTVLGHPTKVGTKVLVLSPLALQCPECDRVTEILDTDLHGYDPEVSGDSATMRGSGERQPYRCSACGEGAGEAVATFSFNDPEGLHTLPEQLAGREQDAFDWFALDWQCSACGELNSVADYERA